MKLKIGNCRIYPDRTYPTMFWVECSDGWVSPDYTNKTRANNLKNVLEERYVHYETFDPI
jgi:hypothetical protein